MNDKILLESIELAKAEHSDFTAYFSVYRENIRLRRDWSLPLTSVPENANCYWIMQAGRRIGGVLINENKLGPMFVIPPHQLTDPLLRDLIAYVKSISEPARAIEAAGVLPSQLELFERNGFEPTLARHGMIRPTDSFEIALSEEFELKQPDPSDIEELASVLLTSFEQGTGDTFMNDSEEELKEDLGEFFTEMEGDDALRTASAVVWDQQTSSIAGVILIGRNEGWPFISYVAVLPAYRGYGIATAMIRHALTSLYGQGEPLLLLFVTVGNKAKDVYEKLGFWSASPVTQMIYIE